MVVNNQTLEQELLESAAGRAVFDSLIQANVNLETISLESVKQMLLLECRQKNRIGSTQRPSLSLC